MGYRVDTTENQSINLAPETVEEEVIQNLWFLYSSMEYSVPLDRGFGLCAVYIDKPIEAAKALAVADIYEKTEKYEPRAKIVNVDFETDYEKGILKPIVEVELNEGYKNTEYTG